MRGYVQVYTGNGKGKTTAALGLAMRAVGAGMKIFFAQFAKGGAYSEIRALQRFGDTVTVRQYGEGKWIRGEPSKEELQSARLGFKDIKHAILSGEYDLVIVDEANIATSYNLIQVDELLSLIRSKPPHVELVLTGRNADEKVIELADLVTEMREIKHYLKQGVKARVGIEK